MATTPISSLSAGTVVATTDLLVYVDVSDTSQAPTGSTLKLTAGTFFTRGTVTTSQPIIDASQTWNAGGVTFAGVKIAITNTASAAASLPFQVLGGAGGATNLFSVRIDGLVTVAAGLTVSASGITVTGNSTITGTLGGITTGTFTVRLTSATSAAGSSFAATGGEWYAHTTNGASMGGFGTSQDVSLLNRNGTVVLGVQANGSLVTLAGALTMAGALTGVTTVTATGLIMATLATQQLSLRYDGSNHLAVTVASNGAATFTCTGAGASFAFQNTLTAQRLASSNGIALGGAAESQSAGVLSIGNTTQSTVGAAGGASALPATPTGYIKTYIGSTQFVVPYYAQA